MWAACLLILGWVLISGGPVRAAMLEAHTWQRWEHGLKSTREYGNPYADVTLRVTYVGPGGRTLRTYGFWDGGDTYRIRCAFPVPGVWQWETYLADRAAQHFTVVQVRPGSEWAGERDRQGQKPFTDKSCIQLNPAYWQAFEGKVQRANESGLVGLVVRLMEPVSRYPESSTACRFARNILARLFGNFVIFSPSFDSAFLPLANDVGRTACDDTAVHLITQHPGTPWNQPTPAFSIRYYDEPYFVAGGGDVTVDLTTVSGTLAVEWLRLAEEVVTQGAPVPGGAKRRLRAPFAGDAAIQLKAEPPQMEWKTK